MKIGLIAHGELPIPPRDWGAVENHLWQQKLALERLGHTVDIANTRAIYDVITAANQRRYHFVHCHSEAFVSACVDHLRHPLAVTSHHGDLHDFQPDVGTSGLHYMFQDTLKAPANIVLSDRIRALYLERGYRQFLRVLRNPVETDAFRFAAHGNGRTICLGRIATRKRQAWLAHAVRDRVPVDFVGPWNRDMNTDFVPHDTAHYLGVWDKTTLYEHLTDYSCLALLSRSEAAPKVALEALAAGLSVVISEACTANLTDEEFITVIPDGEERPEMIAHAIQTAVDRNASLRATIRAYARERFDYAIVTTEYVRIIEEYRDHLASAAGPAI